VNEPARPFLKWAGGKSQLIEQFTPHFPPGLTDGVITTYVEPFLGAGAVYLHLAQRFRFAHAYLLDRNEDLVLTWRTVKSSVTPLVRMLGDMHAEFRARREAGREKYFYEVRERHNAAAGTVGWKGVSDSAVERAAQVVFLNKTCYNGLFRTNARGQFNAPYGRYRDPAILDEENLRRVSKLLQSATITCADFSACERHIDRNTFVYFDPPYRPLNRTSSFTSYSYGSFTDDDQRRLAGFFARVARTAGAGVMPSNSAPMASEPPDRFFEDPYRGYAIHRVYAGRSINSNASRRGRISAIVVRNY